MLMMCFDEYYVLSEMISMPDRILAQKLELLIWRDPMHPNQRVMDELVKMLNDSGTAVAFHGLLPKFVEDKAKEFGIEFEIGDASEHYPCAMPSHPIVREKYKEGVKCNSLSNILGLY
jgi:hypothetical protein